MYAVVEKAVEFHHVLVIEHLVYRYLLVELAMKTNGSMQECVGPVRISITVY